MITRNNYEEFFLLYVDNELSPADRQVVEKFVADNPDLTEEWTSLLECRLQSDDSPVFGDKASLFRHTAAASSREGSAITDENYESWYLSYIDGELDKAARDSVEAFALQHPQLGKELEVWRQTVSVPDPAIIYEHKESLYKSEKTRKVFFLPWMRVAAAAVILVAAGLLLFNSLRKNSDEPRNPSIAAQPVIAPAGTAGKGASAAATAATQAPATVTGKKGSLKKNIPAVTPGPADALYSSDNGRGQRGQDARRALANRRHNGHGQDQGIDRNNSTAQRVQENNGQRDLPPADGGENTAVAATLHPARTDQGKLADPVKRGDIAVGPVAGMDHNISFASQTLPDNSITNDTEDDLIGEPASSKKTKLRGLFRKVSRVLEKTTGRDDPDDKHKVLIGGFQFALK